MSELLTKLLGENHGNLPVLIALAGLAYIGQLQVDALTREVAELKRDQKEITKFLAEHATTWARIAERVDLLHRKN